MTGKNMAYEYLWMLETFSWRDLLQSPPKPVQLEEDTSFRTDESNLSRKLEPLQLLHSLPPLFTAQAMLAKLNSLAIWMTTQNVIPRLNLSCEIKNTES